MTGVAADIKEKQQLSKWEMALGFEWNILSQIRSRVPLYYVFVDSKDAEKITICHAKKKHLPVVSVLQFARRVGVWPRMLVSDGTGDNRLGG